MHRAVSGVVGFFSVQNQRLGQLTYPAHSTLSGGPVGRVRGAMSLADQVNAFKKRVQSQPVLSAPRPVTAPASVAGSPSWPSTPNSNDLAEAAARKRKRARNTVVYSTPADTGSGSHLLSNLTYAVDYLKKSETSKSIGDITSYLNVQSSPSLIQLLQRHEKVDYESQSGLYAFRPLHNIRSAFDLLQFLQNELGGNGLAVKELKDGWPSALDEILRLEEDKLVLVLRAKKDNQPRMVWANDVSKEMPIDTEFITMWRSLAVPSISDLPHELERVNLKPTSVDPATIKRAPAPKKEKQQKPRRGRITNTHLPGILRDYSGGKPQ